MLNAARPHARQHAISRYQCHFCHQTLGWIAQSLKKNQSLSLNLRYDGRCPISSNDTTEGHVPPWFEILPDTKVVQIPLRGVKDFADDGDRQWSLRIGSVHASMHSYTSTCMSSCVHVFMDMRICARMCTYACTHTHTFARVCASACARLQACVHAYV